MKIVIGSGPAGIASAHALLAAGETVTMVDAGIEMESRQQDLLSKIRHGDDAAVGQLKSLQSDIYLSSKGVQIKLAYGSDFPYRGAAEHLGFESYESGLLPSLAFGGLSNVWGASALSYRQEDIGDWPVTVSQLTRHYEAVLQMTGLAGQQDDLAKSFPLYTEHLTELNLSSQARWLLSGLNKIGGHLRLDGILFGASRLMVGPNQTHDQACVYCGECLYGCPYGCIYNSAADVRWLGVQANKRFNYRSNVIVEKVTEAAGAVRVSGFDRLTQCPVQIEGERAFVAAGVIPSSRIMLKSLEAYEHPLQLKDSQYFILPVFSVRGAASREELHTLSQLFLEIQDDKISPYIIHLQLYTYNDIIGKVLRKKLWFAPGLRELLIGPLQQRFLVIQGYLHSAHSGTMSLHLTRDAKTRKERLILRGTRGKETKKIIQQVIRKLTRHLFKLGLVPVSQGVDITLPGRGFHSGGSLPMRNNPASFETDIQGRIPGYSRTHVVDASIFPSIPATTITLTAMANAHRICSTWDQN